LLFHGSVDETKLSVPCGRMKTVMAKPILVEVSVKHVHLCEADLEILFGETHCLKNRKDLSQPGQYACEERVDVIGPKGVLKNIAVLGPLRPSTQIELSMSDCRIAGINAPIRESGDIAGSAGCKIVGPCGKVEIDEGVIVAKRHIHMTPEDAKELNVENNEIVKVEVQSDIRGTIYGDVVVRVHENFALAMHLDTDEGNAAFGGTVGYIVK